MNVRFLTSVAVASALLAACGGGSGTTPSTASAAGNSTLSIALVDGPFRTSGGTVTELHLKIAKVEAVGAGGGVQTIATYSPSTDVDLMQHLTASTALSFPGATIPAGTYSQIRFVLDTSSASNTYMVLNGSAVDLSIPSATSAGFGNNSSTDSGDGAGTSGVKVNLKNFTAAAGQTYGFVVDFNAAESIVSAGSSGQWLMKPVLVATSQATSGSISGTVKNNAGTGVSNAEVLAEDGSGNTINSGVTDANGNFNINALPAGTYTLVVKNSWTSQGGSAQTATGADGTADVTDAGVSVTAGQTTPVTITD